MNENLQRVRALTFDLFGTVLDLGGSLTPPIAEFLRRQGSSAGAAQFWSQLRYRQRIEQYQDTIVALGHGGYLETARRAFVYVCRLNKLEPSDDAIDEWMESWKQLSPFPDATPGLERLKSRYKLVALSNGNPWFLDHLVKERIKFPFDNVISVEVAGAFKPHPGVYRRAAGILEMEVNELLMVSSNSFDVMGARTCGFRGAYVNRYDLPFEDTPYLPDFTVKDFSELADALV